MPDTSFLDLPAELRNKTYALVIKQGEVVYIRYDCRPHASCYSEPNISATNRQVRTETLSMFYSGNTFESIHVNMTINFLNGLGPVRAAMLRDLRPFRWEYIEMKTRSYEGYLEGVFEAMKTLCAESAAGTDILEPTAISVHAGKKLEPEWTKISDIEEFEIVRDGGTWSLEWKKDQTLADG